MTARRSLWTWLFAAAIVPGLSLLFVQKVFLRQVESFDGPWHLTCGRIIVETGQVPRSDPLCFTTEGLDWVNLNWLAQALLYKCYQGFGFPGPLALASLLLGGAMICLALNFRQRQVRPLPGLLGLLLCGFALLQVYDIRPRGFTFALFALLAYVLDKPDPEYEMPWRRWLFLLALVFVWNHLHGGFAYGYALIGLDGLGCAMDSYFAGKGWQPRRAWLLLALIGLGLLSFVSHPHGFAALEHVLLYTQRLNLTIQTIHELKPINFQGLKGRILEVYGLVAFASFYFSRKRLCFRECLPGLLFFHMALVFNRGFVPFIVLTAPWVAVHLSDVLELIEESATDQSPFWHRSTVQLLGFFKQHLEMSWQATLPALLVMLAAWLLIALPLRMDRQPPGDIGRFIKRRDGALGVVRFLKQHKLQGRIFNAYDAGGLLGWALYPERRIFIDGRGDLHARGQGYKDYLRVDWMSAGWKEMLDKHQIDIVICQTKKPLPQSLSKFYNWPAIYNDQKYCLLMRPRSGPETRKNKSPK